MEVVTFSTVTFILGLIGMAIGVYKSINNPQAKLDKNQALNEERDKGKATVLSQKEAESKALLLAQQVQWEKESIDKRFIETNQRLVEATTLAQNHIHTLDTKMSALSGRMGNIEQSIVRLTTVIEERIPRK